MKKLTQLSLALCIALALTGCDNANNTTSNNANNQSQATLTPQEQFRQDYVRFEQWQLETAESTNKEINTLQQTLEKIGLEKNLTAEQVESLVANLRSVISQSIKTLESLNLKAPEITALAEKIKQNQVSIAETIDLAIQIVNKSVDPQTNIPIFEQKTQMLGVQKAKIEVELNQLSQKYHQK